jgi:hypothetical protein
MGTTLKAGLIGTVSAVVGFLVAYFVQISFEHLTLPLRWVVMLVSALAAGAFQGLLFGQSWPKVIGIGSFVGLLVLWSPVVVVTYGFALAAVPLLAAIALLVFFGARLGAKFRVD